MDTKWSLEQRQKVVHEVLKRSATNPEFRSLVLRDANAAVEQVAGKPVPAGFNIRVLERQDCDVTLVLPNPVSPSGELSDVELEQVAGGKRNVG